MKKTILASLIAAASSYAAADLHFSPLNAPATASNTAEATAPFLLPAGYNQILVSDVAHMDVAFQGAYPTTFRAWDMIDFGGSKAEFIYIPHEVQTGAGVTRYNRDTGAAAILLQGNNTGLFSADPATWNHQNDDFGAFDPAVTTPWGSLLAAEEWAGNGRIFEMSNPQTATSPADAQWRWLSNIPSVSHEGIKFDSKGNMYFIDEDNSGSIYKFVPAVAGDLSKGQVFVLKVTNFAGTASATYAKKDTRTGPATWVPMTDANNVALTTANPFDFTTRGGRAAADELGATPYGRPEDLIVGKLATGSEVLYVATTSENMVYSIELLSDAAATVREYFNATTTPDTLGKNPLGDASSASYGSRSPDNLAIDSLGHVYIIEDQNPGDIWMTTDADGDGVASNIALFASLGPFGSEPTGFIADPRDPFSFYVAVQHPSSNNDAMWKISHSVSEGCTLKSGRLAPLYKAQYVACVSKNAAELVGEGVITRDQSKQLIEVAKTAKAL